MAKKKIEKPQSDKVKRLLTLLKHEKNDPTDLIQVSYKERNKKETNDLAFYINIYYCCLDAGDGALKNNKKNIFDALDDGAIALLLLKYKTLEDFKQAFDREMHWIRQTHTRMERFQKISAELFKHFNAKRRNLHTLVEKNFDDILKMMKVSETRQRLEKLSARQVLEEIGKGNVNVDEAMSLLKEIDEKNIEKNADKLCPFSGSAARGRNGEWLGDPDKPTRICSRTENPKKIGDCGSCRVAADWEEAYG